jgi:hypothetical protein
MESKKLLERQALPSQELYRAGIRDACMDARTHTVRTKHTAIAFSRSSRGDRSSASFRCMDRSARQQGETARESGAGRVWQCTSCRAHRASRRINHACNQAYLRALAWPGWRASACISSCIVGFLDLGSWSSAWCVWQRRSESQGGSTTSVVSLEIFEKVTVNSLPWSSATSLVVLAEKLDRTLQHDLGRK